MQYIHDVLFLLTKLTLIKAIKIGFLVAWPLLTYENISRNLTETIVAHQGHLKRVQQSIRSTQRGKRDIEEEYDQFDIK